MSTLLFFALFFAQTADDIYSRLLSPGEAKQMRATVADLSAHSPFDADLLHTAALKLVNAKVPAKDAAVILQRSADAACGLKIESRTRAFALLQIVGGFAEIYKETSVSGRIGINQMEGIGLPVVAMVAEATNQSADTIERYTARGLLSGASFAEIILDCLKDRYSGLAEKAREK